MNKEIVEIEKLKETVKILKREREKLNNKTNEFILKNKKELNGVFDIKINIRDIINQNKNFIIKIKVLKEERNALNQRVSDINNDISEMRKKIDGKNHAKKNNADYDQNTIVDLKQKITKLEWQIQTKPVSIRKEDQMQEQLSKMTNFLRKIKENARYNRKIKRVKSKRNELKEQADEKHKELLELSGKSEKIHNKLLEFKKQKKEEEEKVKPLMDELTNLKKTADAAHQKYIEYLEVLKKKEKKVKKEVEQEEKEEKEEETKKIYDSFKSGKKLSLSELMLIESKLDDELDEEESENIEEKPEVKSEISEEKSDKA